MKYVTKINESEFVVEIVDDRHIRINGQLLEVDFQSISGQPVYSLLLNGKSYEAHVAHDDEAWQVLLRGRLFQARVEDEREKRPRAAGGAGASEGGEFHLKAPMPGLVVSVLVQEGQPVKKGQVLLILESMKMQNELKSPREGIIQRIKVQAGETVEQKQTLLSVV